MGLIFRHFLISEVWKYMLEIYRYIIAADLANRSIADRGTPLEATIT